MNIKIFFNSQNPFYLFSNGINHIYSSMAISHSVRIEINRGRSYYVILPGTLALKSIL